MKPLANELLLRLIDASAEPLLVARVDQPDWPVVLANPAFEALADNGKIRKQPFADVIERLIGRELALEISEAVRSDQKSTLPVEAGGRELLLTLESLVLDDDGGRYCAAYWRRPDGHPAPGADDAHHALVKASRRIRDLVRDDPVTGLMNTTAFREVLEHDWAVAAREDATLALVAFGFDDFQEYFDVFGRHATDSCLRRVAQVIRRTLRRASDVAARIDGEDGGRIVVLSHGSDEENVREFAVRIAAAVRELGLHHPRSRVSRFVTVSFDIGMLTPAGKSTSADEALDRLLAG